MKFRSKIAFNLRAKLEEPPKSASAKFGTRNLQFYPPTHFREFYSYESTWLPPLLPFAVLKRKLARICLRLVVLLLSNTILHGLNLIMTFGYIFPKK